METIRTPDAHFAELEDYPFEPNYVEVDGLACTTSTRGTRQPPRC